MNKYQKAYSNDECWRKRKESYYKRGLWCISDGMPPSVYIGYRKDMREFESYIFGLNENTAPRLKLGGILR